LLDSNKPYAPAQFWGEYAHGIIENTSSWFYDGLIISALPGQGMGWNDGTATASVTGTEISAGNVSVDLVPVGTGPVNIKGILIGKAYTIAAGGNQIPACVSGNAGAKAYVTDFSGAPTYHGAIGAGGSTVGTPVFCNGSAWLTD
jgi:hypothetical protein